MGGMSYCTIVSAKNQQNLMDFRYGFVKIGGVFRSREAGKPETLHRSIVKDSEFHEVFTFVRASLQESSR